MQTWSTWASIDCNTWYNNRHATTHPPTAMARVRWRQRRTEKAWWKRRVIEQEDARKTRRGAVIGTAVKHRQSHRAGLRHNTASNLVQGEAESGNRINRTSTRLTVRITKSLADMALPMRHQKVYRIKMQLQQEVERLETGMVL